MNRSTQLLIIVSAVLVSRAVEIALSILSGRIELGIGNRNLEQDP